MGTRMRTRPIARKGEGAPSRKHKREHSKSGIRLDCQRKTRGAANRARKSVAGINRRSFTYVDAQYEAHLDSTYGRGLAVMGEMV